jgi:hypothetical protein
MLRKCLMRRLNKYAQYGMFLAILVIVTGLTACTGGNPDSNSGNIVPSASAAQNLALIQENGNLSARFYGLMTFRSLGTDVTFPSDLSVPPISIYWMGVVFNGRLEETGAGEDVTYEVHGGVSADGNWVESVYFSRQVLRKTIDPSGSFFRVTLRSIPISNTAGQPGIFEKIGADVQKYISKIEYSDGPMNGKQIASNTDYISTDWKNTTSARMPILKLAFGKGPGKQKEGAPAPGGMMGQ